MVHRVSMTSMLHAIARARKVAGAAHLIEAFLDMMSAERGAGANTLAAYRRDLLDFAGHSQRRTSPRPAGTRCAPF